MKKYLLFILCLALTASANAQNSPQHVSSDAELLQMAGNKYASGEVPLGDNHYTLDAPRKGYIYLCHKFGDGGGGAGRDGNWIHATTWNFREKLAVQGNVKWDDAAFSVTNDGEQRVLTGNGLPIDHTTGVFPVQPNDPAYSVDRNPNRIQAQSFRETLPANPVYTDPPVCMGMEVGTMLSGVPLFNGFDAELRDAAAHEVQDSCQGHPQQRGQYHYHNLSSCIQDVSEKTVIGYALDGFPITGPALGTGKYLTTADLDECHGITSEIVQDGQRKISYHYVMTIDFPYSASCFRGQPVRTGPAQQPGQNQNRQNANAPMGDNQGMRSIGPPPGAFDACSGMKDGDGCGFTSPRGDQITGRCHAPTGILACVPERGR